MRKLNFKLALILLAAVAAAAGGVWALHTFQYQRIAAALLWQARHAEQDQKFDQMVRYLQRYLEFAPHDVEQAAHLGATLAGEHFAGSPAARRQAYYVLNNVVNQQPERIDLQRLLVKTALEVGEWSTANATLDALAKNPEAGAPDSPERGELEGYWARLLVAEKKPDEAIEHSRLAVKEAANDEDSYVRLATLLRGRKDASGTCAQREQGRRRGGSDHQRPRRQQPRLGRGAPGPLALPPRVRPARSGRCEGPEENPRGKGDGGGRGRGAEPGARGRGRAGRQGGRPGAVAAAGPGL